MITDKKLQDERRLKKDFLLEIGTEEIPSGYLKAACEKFKESFIAATAANFIEVSNVETFASPRRIVLFASGIDKAQASKLKKLLPGLIKGIYFPKRMMWDDSNWQFARPVRWLFAILGKEKFVFELGNLKSDNLTYGSILNAKKPVRIKTANLSEFKNTLKKNHVILDEEERKEIIRKELMQSTKFIDEDLLEENANLVEEPVCFVGEFNKKYLSLPKEVLIASMSKFQRIFALAEKNGKLSPKFLAVTNGCREKGIKKNFENVLEAKLKDSLFFYNEDKKLSLDSLLERLKDVMFLKNLGSLFDKSMRLTELAGFLCSELKFSKEDTDSAKRAASLCKADLTTQIVREFPSLQGVMAREYALSKGEGKNAADAALEHYLPVSTKKILPESNIGACLSISDKLDTIVGCFAIGLIPSGSFDPFALRRAANGIISICLERKWEVSFDKLLDAAILNYGDLIKKPQAEIKNKIKEFFKARLSYELKNIFPQDLVDSCLSKDFDNLGLISLKLAQLNSIYNELTFKKAVKVVQRTYNIVKLSKDLGEVRQEEFTEDLERKLWDIFVSNKEKMRSLIEKRDFKSATILYGAVFYGTLNLFFEKVHINVDDEKLRKNRLAMMQAINNLYTKDIADLEKIKLPGELEITN